MDAPLAAHFGGGEFALLDLAIEDVFADVEAPGGLFDGDVGAGGRLGDGERGYWDEGLAKGLVLAEGIALTEVAGTCVVGRVLPVIEVGLGGLVLGGLVTHVHFVGGGEEALACGLAPDAGRATVLGIGDGGSSQVLVDVGGADRGGGDGVADLESHRVAGAVGVNVGADVDEGPAL